MSRVVYLIGSRGLAPSQSRYSERSIRWMQFPFQTTFKNDGFFRYSFTIAAAGRISVLVVSPSSTIPIRFHPEESDDGESEFYHQNQSSSSLICCATSNFISSYLRCLRTR
jgi:hypothetical protein